MRWVVALLLAAVLLTSCTDAPTGSSGAESVPGVGGEAPAVGDQGGGAQGGGQGARDVISTGSMTLVVADARDAADRVAAIVEGAGGRVDERSEQAGGEGIDPAAWLTVRVPSADLTATLDRLESLGEARDLTISSQDVTRETRDLDARITALQTSVDRLLALMSGATTSADLIAAENALSARQSDLEALKAERAGLAERVDLATLRIQLVTARSPSLAPGGFLGGLATGWDALVSFASAVLVTLGVLLPWLLVLAGLAAVVLAVVRRRRKVEPEPAPREPQDVGAG